MQKFDWGAYWQNNMVNLTARCNFISRVLAKTILISFALFILLFIIYMLLSINLQIAEGGLLENTIFGIFIVVMTVLFYSVRVYVIVAPLLFVLQCATAIKYKKYNPWILRHIFLWGFLVLLSLYSYNNNQEFNECMEKCVAADKSNIQECAFNYCDPAF